LTLRPGDAPLLLQRALVHEQLGRARELGGDAGAAARARAQAAADFDQALAVQADNPRALLLRGLFRIRTGAGEHGCQDLEQALARAPADWPHADLCREELTAARRAAFGR
jgi:hypothetical protein